MCRWPALRRWGGHWSSHVIVIVIAIAIVYRLAHRLIPMHFCPNLERHTALIFLDLGSYA